MSIGTGTKVVCTKTGWGGHVVGQYDNLILFKAPHDIFISALESELVVEYSPKHAQDHNVTYLTEVQFIGYMHFYEGENGAIPGIH